MAADDLEAADIERKVHNLAEAMNRVRSNQADRDDVVVDMKHSKISRLELLASDLAPVFNDLPAEVEQFEFAITNGETPRFWIDMTSFVRMGADGREYEFVKDTRLGRTVLARSSDRTVVGTRISDYVAERVLERERMIEGDWISARKLLETSEPKDASEESKGSSEEPKEASTRKIETKADVNAPASGGSNAIAWLLTGLAAGLAILLGLATTDRLEPLLQYLGLASS